MLPKISKFVQRLLVALLTGLLSASLVLALGSFSFTKQWMTQVERIFYDLTFKFKYVYTLDNLGNFETDSVEKESALKEDRIQVVDIDERSLEKLGAYNLWPRSNHAKVVDYLSEGGASAIAFDILFKNADFGEERAREAIEVMRTVEPRQDWTAHQRTIRSLYNYDSVLIDAVRRSGISIVCATLASKNAYIHKSQWQKLSSADWAEQVSPESSLDTSQVPLSSVQRWELLDNIFPELAHAGKWMGLINVNPDDDGVHRSEPLFHAFPDSELAPEAIPRVYPILALQTVVHLFGIKPGDLIVKPGEYVELGKPLGIGRDSSGELYTTYPNLSWPMLRQVMESAQKIRKLQDTSSKTRILDLATQVIVMRNQDGELSAQIAAAQELTTPMLDALLNTPGFDTLYAQFSSDSDDLPLKAGFHLAWSDEENAPILVDEEEDEEVVLDPYTVRVLLEGRHRIDAMNAGQRIFLSSNLDVQWKPETEKYRSNYIILGDDVIHELLQTDPSVFESLKPGELKRVGNIRRIPIDAHNRMQINYLGLYQVKSSQRAFNQISYYELVERRVDNAAFQGKVFILGSTAPALFDMVSAPHESEYPGVLIHATLVENILNDNYLKVLQENWQIWIVFALAILCALLAQWVPPTISLPLLLVLLGVYFFISMDAFNDGTYIGMARQYGGMFLSTLLVLAVRYVFEEREKRFLNSTFKSYLSPELIDMMVESGERPSLGGEEKFVTAYFTDIASFSTFSEKIGRASELVVLLNEYLGSMTDILMRNRGTLDKYVGDAIVAIFGAPLSVPNHAVAACNTALEMQDRLAELREKWKGEGSRWPSIVHAMRMRIGINTGNIVTGNMGSSIRMNYTMMGDSVNLAARLESGAKQYGVFTMVSRMTLNEVPQGAFVYRVIDKLRVKGKTEPVEVCELLAKASDSTPELEHLVRTFHQARGFYESMQWDLAIARFTECLDLEPNHPERSVGTYTTPSHVFLERSRKYKEHPPVDPGETWDGVYTAKEK